MYKAFEACDAGSYTLSPHLAFSSEGPVRQAMTIYDLNVAASFSRAATYLQLAQRALFREGCFAKVIPASGVDFTSFSYRDLTQEGVAFGDAAVFPALLYEPSQWTNPSAGIDEKFGSQCALLMSAIRRRFANATFQTSQSVDPEEGWERHVLEVKTGEADIERRMDIEDLFYEDVAKSDSLRAAIRQITIAFE